METNNIISTPDITGNIGTCTSQSVEVISGRTFWKENVISVVTNSCTGEIKEYQSWQLSDIGFGIIFMSVASVLFVLMIIGSIIEEKHKKDRYEY